MYASYEAFEMLVEPGSRWSILASDGPRSFVERMLLVPEATPLRSVDLLLPAERSGRIQLRVEEPDSMTPVEVTLVRLRTPLHHVIAAFRCASDEFAMNLFPGVYELEVGVEETAYSWLNWYRPIPMTRVRISEGGVSRHSFLARPAGRIRLTLRTRDGRQDPLPEGWKVTAKHLGTNETVALRQMCFFGGMCGNPASDPRLNRSRDMLELLEPGDQRLRVEVPGYVPAESMVYVVARRYTDVRMFLTAR